MPSTELRQNVLASARRVVVKLGSAVLTDRAGRIEMKYLRQIAGQIAGLIKRGVEVSVVSSGAVAAGCGELGLSRRPGYVAEQQAVAAVGQRRLMTYMHDAFEKHGLQVGQMLLTRGDFEDRSRFLNIRNCVGRLHKLGCVPIVNENDTVAVDEIRFGDNDVLAALLCNALSADALVLLTVVDGLLDRAGKVLDLVDDVSVAAELIRQQVSSVGTGGMASKLEAARIVTQAGEIAVIAAGREKDVLTRLFAAERVGTVFVPASRRLDSRQRWIGLTKRPAGTIEVDAGAAQALSQKGKSLLAIGVTGVIGRFERGQAVVIHDPAGRPIARGLCNYTAEEVRQVMGKRSNQVQKALGRAGYAVVIHRDHLVLVND